MTRSLYQVPYFELTCAPKHALPHHVFRGARRQSVKIGVSKSKRINVAGQGQPKHLNIQPHGQYHAADQISCRSYVGSVYRMRSLAVYGFSLMYFRTVGLFRSDTLRFLSMVLAMLLNV